MVLYLFHWLRLFPAERNQYFEALHDREITSELKVAVTHYHWLTFVCCGGFEAFIFLRLLQDSKVSGGSIHFFFLRSVSKSGVSDKAQRPPKVNY